MNWPQTYRGQAALLDEQEICSYAVMPKLFTIINAVQKLANATQTRTQTRELEERLHDYLLKYC
jgi:hypothetical protein